MQRFIFRLLLISQCYTNDIQSQCHANSTTVLWLCKTLFCKQHQNGNTSSIHPQSRSLSAIDIHLCAYLTKLKRQITLEHSETVCVRQHSCVTRSAPHATCATSVLQALSCQLLACVAPYQTDSGGADIIHLALGHLCQSRQRRDTSPLGQQDSCPLQGDWEVCRVC